MGTPEDDPRDPLQGRLSRRRFLQALGVVSGATLLGVGSRGGAAAVAGAAGEASEATPAAWPTPAQWAALRRRVGGRLLQPTSPLAPCLEAPEGAACSETLSRLSNPFFLEEQPGATQSTGWLDAWQAAVSPWAVAAESAADIAAAVDFARTHGMRLVVKGTGHDYLGRSNAPDSLLVWTHAMRTVTVHRSFVPDGAPAETPGVTALSVGAGTRWLEAYGAAAHAGLYVQGGGCTSVGASGGFIQGSGFGSFSKRYGTGAGGVLELEVVTADGAIRVVNAHRDPELFWALRGGGGGTFGIVSRTTLLAHPIPERVGTVTGTIAASDEDAWRRLVAAVVDFYPKTLDGPAWGEQIRFRTGREIELAMTFLDLTQAEAESAWAPLLGPLRADPAYRVDVRFRALPFRHLWDVAWWQEHDPGFVVADPRRDQPASQYWWAGNQGEVSAFWTAYHSRWIPLAMFTRTPDALVDMLVETARLRPFIVQINKGLSGEHPEARARDLQTSLHPGAFDAAALLIMASLQPRAFPGVPGHEPDLARARADRDEVERAMRIVRAALPGQGAYANEADFFTESWKQEFWGPNYERLLAIKRRVDPSNLFRVHHGVGSDL